ncbi:LacI family DNA-binding transcriptional regulator [Aureimonas pseudogalii]|uniref:LacI family transcriptional regulator n=1 Tax=Aureimonas pseudogalii TaxID=1744844 RepID=A0A7W6MLK6_9HYPH|nr:LacI family DNA-binding transcriptional regulator [Aureimonas pseudogalii]MBB3999882.1 LacI family transcriptional regulator [Aureimonas pseudogalii]
MKQPCPYQQALDLEWTAILDISLATVAERAGVSVSTVSRIVNGETRRASPETVARVLRAVEEVGYRPNSVGRALRTRQSQVVAMLVANLDNPVMATIASSTEAALRNAGYVMILCDTHDRADLQDEYLEAMRSQLVCGFVLVAAVPSRVLSKLCHERAPLVFVTRRSPHGVGAFVGIDDRAAGAAVAECFVSDKRQRLGVVLPVHSSPAAKARVAGFADRLAELGVDPRTVRHEMGEGTSHLDVGYDAAHRIFEAGPVHDALFCLSDQIAYGVHRRARERGIEIPEACSLISIDGSPLNAWIAPWLCSIQIPYANYGEEIVSSLKCVTAEETAEDRILPIQMASYYGPIAKD